MEINQPVRRNASWRPLLCHELPLSGWILGLGFQGRGRGSQDREEEGLRATSLPDGISAPLCPCFPADSRPKYR